MTKSAPQNQHAPVTRNLHTHLWYCLHAEGIVDDYCRYAQKIDMKMLGISDHTPMPVDPVDDERMTMNQLDEYSKAIDAAKNDYADLHILKGMECESVFGYHSFYRDELLRKRRFDYLTCGIHYVKVNGRWVNLFEDTLDVKGLLAYVDHFVDMLEANLYTFIVHPDIFGFAYPDWDANVETCARDIMQAAVAFNMPLEINSKGFRKPMIQTRNGPRYRYPWTEFWEVASEYNISTIINTDAHKPEELTAAVAEARRLLNACQLYEISDVDIRARMRRIADQNKTIIA